MQFPLQECNLISRQLNANFMLADKLLSNLTSPLLSPLSDYFYRFIHYKKKQIHNYLHQ